MDEIGEYMQSIETMEDEVLRETIVNLSKVPEIAQTRQMQNITVAMFAELNRRGASLNSNPNIKYGAMFITDNLRLFCDEPIRIESMLNAWGRSFEKQNGYMVSDHSKTPHYKFEKTYKEAEQAMEDIYLDGTTNVSDR